MYHFFQEDMRTGGSCFIPNEPAPHTSSSSSYLRIGTSSLQIVNPSSQMEDSGGGGGYDFFREDSDSENSETNSDGMESLQPFLQNAAKKRSVS